MQALIQERIEAAAVRSDEVLGSLVVIIREHTGSAEAAMVKNAIAAATQLCKILGMFQRARANQDAQNSPRTLCPGSIACSMAAGLQYLRNRANRSLC